MFCVLIVVVVVCIGMLLKFIELYAYIKKGIILNVSKSYFKKKVLVHDYLMKAKYSRMSSLADAKPLQTPLCISPRGDEGKH